MFNRSFDQIIAPLDKMAGDLQELRQRNADKMTQNDAAIDRLRQSSIELTDESLKAQAVQQKIEALIS